MQEERCTISSPQRAARIHAVRTCRVRAWVPGRTRGTEVLLADDHDGQDDLEAVRSNAALPTMADCKMAGNEGYGIVERRDQDARLGNERREDDIDEADPSSAAKSPSRPDIHPGKREWDLGRAAAENSKGLRNTCSGNADPAEPRCTTIHGPR
ncbi:hypothetical protein V8E36_009427 [Tilletia maclaganii]